MGVGVSRHKSKFCPRPLSAENGNEFPVHGNLGLTETEKIRIKSSWDKIGDIDQRRSFMGAFLFNIMSKNEKLKMYFRLKNIRNEDLTKDQLFHTHIGNFSGVFRVCMEGLVKKTGAVQRKGRQMGAHHRKFDDVKFEVGNWIFMIDQFVETLKTFVVDLSVEDEILWKRFIKWFFSQMHRAHELGNENYESD